MKIFAFAFAILVAGASAAPSDVETAINERFVAGIIADTIADVSQNIRDAGLDPVDIPYLRDGYTLPVTNLLRVDALVENLFSYGLSNIVINRASYNILTSRLILDISLPEIFVSARTAEVDILLMGWRFSAAVGGSLEIVEPRLYADVRINVGIISGISIRSITVDFTLRAIRSHLNLLVQGNDLSDVVNNFASYTLPRALDIHKSEINELLEYIILQIAEDAL